MLGVAGWWDRNGVEVQGLSTIALLSITSVYVVITGRIAGRTRDQAKASLRQAAAAEEQVEHGREALRAEQADSALQLEQMRKALQAQEGIARQADSHAQSVLIESARARLSAITPVCTVLYGGSPMQSADGGSIGNIPMEQYDGLHIVVHILFRVRNDGPSPVLFTAIPTALDDVELLAIPDWTVTTKDEVAMAGIEYPLTYRIRGPGQMFRRWGIDRRQVEIEIETRSPISGVTDRHFWKGIFPIVDTVPGSSSMFDHNRASGFVGPSAAHLTRSWPTDLTH